MLKYLLLFLLLLLGLAPALFAQERIVSGTLTDETGFPLPGVNIVIKGTAQGTVTDRNGFYSIRASIGATLVFSYIGYTSYEVVVTAQNSESVDAQPGKAAAIRKRYARADSAQKGIARMGDASPEFVLKHGNQNGLPLRNMIPYAYDIRYVSPRWAGIRYGKAGRNGMFVVKGQVQPKSPIQLNYTSAFSLDKVYKLPELQNTYSQGRPLNANETWQGPETGEIFSWGPKLANLQYDGVEYPYSRQGKLVTRGIGNGLPATSYNPYSFFRNGSSNDNALSLHKTLGETTVDLGFQQKQQRYIVPNSDYSRHNANLRIHTPIVYGLEANYALYYSQAAGDLLQRGANMASIFSSVVRTPPSFDNTNGYSGKSISKNVYTLENGQPRSSSPGSIDNPYWLSYTSPDREQVKSVLSTLQLKYHAGYDFSVAYNLGIDKQWSTSQYGLAPLSAGSTEGRLTQRHDRQTTVHSILASSYRKYLGNFSLEAVATYDLSYTERHLNRTDASGFPDAEFNLSAANITDTKRYFLSRTAHEINTTIHLQYSHLLNVKLTNHSYYSSTLLRNNVFLPGAGIGFVFTNLGPLQNSAILRYGRLYTSYAQSVKEAPLLYNQWHFNSTNLRLANYLQYVENQELPATTALQPEQYRKWEYGLALNLFNYRFGTEFQYFTKHTAHALAPILADGNFTLANVADICNKGYELSLQYSTTSEHAFTWQSKLSVSSFKPIVTKLYGQEQRIPVAGFSEVSTNLVAGQPYGVIYGNTYHRNEEGQVIIGTNGFPLVDPELKPIGNPNPDWIAGLDNTFRWKAFALSLILDIRKGGDVWNGTQQALNYLGMSRYTQEARNIRQYIFEGVREDGSPNTQPVDFANPANGLAGNRWVQYGFSGVAEDAMEDGSWIRLNELKLACQLNQVLPKVHRFPQLTLSFTGKNLLLLTRYSGVDPATTLFGYEAAGLDFFNLPATRSYGMTLQLKL